MQRATEPELMDDQAQSEAYAAADFAEAHSRIVDTFGRRLQIQENLTQQIAEAILKYTNAIGVGVVIEAQHLCMMMRGVEKQNSSMITSCMLGAFRDDASTRSEFLSLIKR